MAVVDCFNLEQDKGIYLSQRNLRDERHKTNLGNLERVMGSQMSSKSVVVFQL